MTLSNRAPVLVALVAAAFAAQAAVSVAKAQEKTDYKDVYGNVLNAIGFGSSRDPIDYTPHAPIAVPPSNDLPTPAAGTTRAANFPVDPDALARRKALADPRQPVPPIEGGKNRSYLIEPPSSYFDPAAVAATGTQVDHGDAPAAAAKHKRKAKPVATATQ